MIAEIGQYAMILALVTALILSIFPMVGAQSNRPHLMAIARPASWALFIWVAVALYRCRNLILDRERHADWVKEVL